MTPSSSTLLTRACTVQIGTLLFPCGQGTGLDVAFKIKRGLQVTQGSIRPRPNTCDLKIWGLNPDHRKQLEQSNVPAPGTVTTIPAVITAGYVGRVSNVFTGQLRAGNSVTDEADVVTELTTGDGDEALQQARITVALGPGANAQQGLKAILSSLGVGDGNLHAGIALLAANPLAAQLFAKGIVLKGSPADLMSDFARAAGLEWSIQHGALQLLAIGKPLDGQAILIDQDHGMIGSPTVDTKGILSVKVEMLPGIEPGCKIAMNSQTVQGGYRVIGFECVGDTFGNDWGFEIEAARY